jgi:protein TonB
MLRTLLESQATASRRAGGTLISVGVHTAAIALAIAATARATIAPRDQTPAATKVLYVAPQPNEPQHRVAPPGPTSTFRVVVPETHVSVPTFIPREIPPVDFTRLPIDVLNTGRVSLAKTQPGGSEPTSPSDGVYPRDLVEKAVVPRPGNPAPPYPASLRSAQIEGSVIARFVVDTLGRVEPASINFPEATHVLFADAVRQSLLRSRYLPAVVQEHAVRQLVEQRFAFTLTR